MVWGDGVYPLAFLITGLLLMYAYAHESGAVSVGLYCMRGGKLKLVEAVC